MKMKYEFFGAAVAALSVVALGAAERAPRPAPAASSVQTSAGLRAAEKKAAAALTETDEIDLIDASLSATNMTMKMAAPSGAAVPAVPLPTNTADAASPALDESALIDITCEDATLVDVLRQFRKTTGANIIYSTEISNLSQRVSVSLNRVPWLKALESILNTRKFRLQTRGEIYFVSEDFEADPVLTRPFSLNHASAIELAKLFNDSYGQRASDGKLLKSVATSFSGANVVVVTAPERVIADCEAIIKSVDRAAPQIYIEARFIELSNAALHKLGVQWDQLQSWGASVKGLSGGMSYNNGNVGVYRAGQETTYYTEKQPDASGTDRASGKSAVDYVTQNYMTGSSMTDSGSGRDMSWRNARGFSGQLSADDFHLAMSAFERMDDAKVFSNPKIIVSNGKEANVDMTTKFPCVEVSASRSTSGGGSDALDISTKLSTIPGEDRFMFAKEAFFSWGITLSVKPRISPDGLISVEIVPAISQLDTDVTPTGFYQVSGGDSSAYSSYPIISVKRLTTDFTMKDGSTAVIGGLSKTTEDDIDSGIPYLRKIPWIGQKLFGWKSRGKVQKEILVFVTVGIADPADLPNDIGLPKNAVLGRAYTDGRQLEPGDRENAIEKSLKLDMESLETQASNADKANTKKKGIVIIKPSAPASKPKAKAVKKAKTADRPAAEKKAAAKPIITEKAKPIATEKAKPVATEKAKPVAEKKSVAKPAAVEKAKPAEAQKAAQPKPAANRTSADLMDEMIGK